MSLPERHAIEQIKRQTRPHGRLGILNIKNKREISKGPHASATSKPVMKQDRQAHQEKYET